MTVLSDKWIKRVAQKGMIKPFVNKQVRKGKISFGLSSYGYDARVSNDFKIFTNVNSTTVDTHCPTPTQSVAGPYLTSSLFISCSSVVKIRAPEHPNG